MERLANFADDRIDGDRHYLTAYNGKRWHGGFDLPFLRSVCVRQEVEWPFPDIAYTDTMDMVEGFDTGGVSDLVGVYEVLIGDGDCDPSDDSASTVATHEDGDWVPPLLHHLTDIERTRELAVLSGHYIPKSDFTITTSEDETDA